jgi:hypothetical protein
VNLHQEARDLAFEMKVVQADPARPRRPTILVLRGWDSDGSGAPQLAREPPGRRGVAVGEGY